MSDPIHKIDRTRVRIELQRRRQLETITADIEYQVFRGSGVIETGSFDHRAVLGAKPPTGIAEPADTVTQGILKSRATVVNLLPGNSGINGIQVAVVQGVRANLGDGIQLAETGNGQYRSALPIRSGT